MTARRDRRWRKRRAKKRTITARLEEEPSLRSPTAPKHATPTQEIVMNTFDNTEAGFDANSFDDTGDDR